MGVHRHIADALARHAQALGEGVAGQCVGVELGRIGHLHPAEGDLPVGFVRDQEDVVAVFLAGGGQVVGKPGQRLGAVGHAAGIVGRVDQHRGGVLVHETVQRLKVDLEILHTGRRHTQRQPGALHVGLVFREKRRKGHHVLARHRHATHGVGQRARRARGHEDVVRRVVHPETPVQAFRHLGAHFRQRQRGSVPVQRHRVGVFQQVQAGFGELRRTGYRRIAQRIVKYVVVSDLLAPRRAPFGNFPNHRLRSQHIFVVLRNHCTLSPLQIL